ncbi:MAG: NTP transferase domain-containing protein [Candidatus Omnitrophica bacterium]|nr:NTP transferase domain-containing protein [Candidatus Omnitrophota bacterium]
MNLSKTDMVILCGGLGTRLRSTIGQSQKIMAAVGEEPFLNKVLRHLQEQGFRRIILAVGYQAQQVEQYYRAHDMGLIIEFSREELPLGTGGAIKNAQSLIESDQFFAMNGDCFCSLNYQEFLKFHLAQKSAVTLSVAKIAECRDYGTVLLGAHDVIVGFEEKKDVAGGGFVNIGAYCFNKEVLELMPAGKFSIELDFFPVLPVKLGERFRSFVVDQEFLDIGTPERYSSAQETIRKVKDRGHKN